MTMDPISMVVGAVPMVTGLLDKGMDLAKGALDVAGKLLDKMPDAEKIAGNTESQPQNQITF